MECLLNSDIHCSNSHDSSELANAVVQLNDRLEKSLFKLYVVIPPGSKIFFLPGGGLISYFFSRAVDSGVDSVGFIGSFVL